MAVMGPGIRAGYVDQSIALNIDFMPTFTELAGGIVPADVDGASLVPLLLKAAPMGSNRQNFLVDYYGEGSPETGVYSGPNSCVEARIRGGHNPEMACGDASNNTYHCVRQLLIPPTGTRVLHSLRFL